MDEENKSIKILIVEDEMIIALALEKALEDYGFTVVGKAVSGEESVKMTIEREPDVVLMDIILKGEMTGIDAALKIWDSSSAHVIFTTGNTYLLDGLKTEMTYEAMSKPVYYEELFKIIQRHRGGS